MKKMKMKQYLTLTGIIISLLGLQSQVSQAEEPPLGGEEREETEAEGQNRHDRPLILSPSKGGEQAESRATRPKGLLALG